VIVYKNYDDPEIYGRLSQIGFKPKDTGGIGGSAAAEMHEITKKGNDPKRLYRWEVIPRDSYILIHTFPSESLLSHGDEIYKHWASLRLSAQLNLIGKKVLVEWIPEANSVCISFTRVERWELLVDMFLEDAEKDFYRRLYLSRKP